MEVRLLPPELEYVRRTRIESDAEAGLKIEHLFRDEAR